MLNRKIILTALTFLLGNTSALLADRADDLKKYHSLLSEIEFFPKQDYKSVATEITLGANSITFMSFYFDQVDLPWCHFYVGGQVVESQPADFTGYVDESFAFSVHGATAVQVGSNVVEYKDVQITWPNPILSTIAALRSDYQGNYSQKELIIFEAIRKVETSLQGAPLSKVSSFLNTVSPHDFDKFFAKVNKERLALMAEKGHSNTIPEEYLAQPVVFFFKDMSTLRLPVADVDVEKLVNNLNELGSHCAKFAR